MPDESREIDADLFDDDGENTIECPKCGQAIYEDAEQCPSCKMWLTPAKRVGGRGVIWLMVFLMVLAAIAFALSGRALF